jgi:uncharacterized membrane protein YdfJ with MMPL/SSD domain
MENSAGRRVAIKVVEGSVGRAPAAAIMVCVFLSFTLGNQRTRKEFGLGLAAAVFLDALVVRCMLLPAVLELLGPVTWRLPRSLDARLPRINIEGTAARVPVEPGGLGLDKAAELEPTETAAGALSPSCS